MPLLIALDQENGGVNSLHDELYISQFPSAMGIAATGSQSLAHEVAVATAKELKAVGVNWVLGPVLDVLNDVKSRQSLGVRTVSDDPQEVSRYGIEFMKGFQEAGLATCGKHFPSYCNLEFLNSCTGGAHAATESPEQQPNLTALAPFCSTIAEGLDSMMVGGVPMSSTGGGNVMHGSLSEQVVHRLLRERLGFRGVVVSECLEMEALAHSMGISGGTVMAKNAGCDIILLCRSFAEQQEAIDGLKFGIGSGIIGRAQIESSLRRVLRMKAQCTSWEQALNPPGLRALVQMQHSHGSLSKKAYYNSISVVRDERNLLPLSSILDPGEELLLLTPLVKPLPTSAVPCSIVAPLDSSFEDPIGWERMTSILSGESVFKELGRSLSRQRNGRVLHTSYTTNGVRPLHEDLIERAGAVIVVTTDANRHLYQQGFTKHVKMLARDKKPLVVVAASSPYDFAMDGSVETYVCTYDFTEAALQAVVQILDGPLSPSGTLPGSVRRSPKLHRARQHWLVEDWNEKRDSQALDSLLDAIRAGNNTSGQSPELVGVTANSFLLRRPEAVVEGHLVVWNRRSSGGGSHALYGFCSTYFFPSTGTGAIGSLIVDPSRRNLSIGSTLHHRAIRTLLQRKGLQRLQLGCCLPGIYLGIPANHPAERKRLRQWFANRGWKTGLARPVRSVTLRDLSTWTPPESVVAQLLLNHHHPATVRYELVYGWDFAETVINYVKMTTAANARSGTQDIYGLALGDAPNCGIIRALRIDDGAVVGSVVIYNGRSVLATHSPVLRTQQQQQITAGGITAPIVSSADNEHARVLQGLVLLGIKQIRKQGGNAVVLDNVSAMYPISMYLNSKLTRTGGRQPVRVRGRIGLRRDASVRGDRRLPDADDISTRHRRGTGLDWRTGSGPVTAEATNHNCRIYRPSDDPRRKVGMPETVITGQYKTDCGINQQPPCDECDYWHITVQRISGDVVMS